MTIEMTKKRRSVLLGMRNGEASMLAMFLMAGPRAVDQESAMKNSLDMLALEEDLIEAAKADEQAELKAEADKAAAVEVEGMKAAAAKLKATAPYSAAKPADPKP
jgi:hypothetical protein